ncbi:hypothetical protein Lalb_Chr17g0339041 [Lupinus albus]|uniref:Uncharacterized protein n=1 Tax=Lupinus albus TaxID=3870 RepID=A0A6A4P211_LUPAL|nr:hypothetical protein Lalb_Chr17g0339041 [Lupinus albus]
MCESLVWSKMNMSCLYVVVNKIIDFCCCLVGTRNDPKIGGGIGGNCKATKDQTQHSPR